MHAYFSSKNQRYTNVPKWIEWKEKANVRERERESGKMEIEHRDYLELGAEWGKKFEKEKPYKNNQTNIMQTSNFCYHCCCCCCRCRFVVLVFCYNFEIQLFIVVLWINYASPLIVSMKITQKLFQKCIWLHCLFAKAIVIYSSDFEYIQMPTVGEQLHFGPWVFVLFVIIIPIFHAAVQV